jgi:hypothetical protein
LAEIIGGRKSTVHNAVRELLDSSGGGDSGQRVGVGEDATATTG